MNPPNNLIDLLARIAFSYLAFPAIVSVAILVYFSDWRATDIAKQIVYLLSIIAGFVIISFPAYFNPDFLFRNELRLLGFILAGGILTRIAYISARYVMLPKIRERRAAKRGNLR